MAETWERCMRWPDVDDGATYRVVCSCGRWEATGTVAEVNAASIAHDDSPWSHHIVSVRARKAGS